ncbi:GerAB/ArcD/ProY family transporter [Neobacillus sp. D3-1R]|uniref:GerAB/ArcD/ProY family transporter n=1 Tax=Neobacillus sp. D3-1R TaxID=3445778 RepID=UPI003F9F0FEB
MKVQITNGMYMALIINMVYAKSIGLTQGSMSREVGSDNWISTLIASIFAMVLLYLTVIVSRRLPKKDFLSQGKGLIGNLSGRMLGCVFFIFFLGAFGSVMTTFVYHLKDYFLPDAPTWIFILVAIIVGSYGIYFGIEVVARMALIGVFSILLLNILLLLGSVGRFDINELLPIFQSGFWPVVLSSRHHLADWSMVIIMAGIILPLVRQQDKWARSSLAGVAFGTIFIIMWPILETGVLSAEVTGQYIVSCMQMARSAQIGIYIHRYEMIMIAFFAISILTQIMMTLFCASVSVQRIFNLKDYRTIIIPVSLLFGLYGYWIVNDHHRAMKITENLWVYLALSVSILVPILLFILGFFFGKEKENMQSES